MSNKIEKYILDRSEELVFITINESGELGLEGFEIPEEGFKVPMRSEVLVKHIKEKESGDDINMLSMVDAMLYLEGIDSGFRYNKDYDRFIEAFSEKTGFDYMQYMGYMSTKLYNSGEVTDALIYIKSYLRKKPDDVQALYQYGIICQDMASRYQKDENLNAMNDFLLEALHSFEKITDLESEFALAYYQLGFHYLNQQQFVKAKITWEKAIELGLDSELMSETQENLENICKKVIYEEGYNLIFKGKPKEALEKLLPLENEFPDWWNLLFMISLAYKSEGNFSEAKKYLEKILIFRPDQVDTLVELALLYAEEGRLDTSIDLLTKASKLKKDDPEILCNLGMAYLHNGEYDEARYYIQTAYEIDPLDEVTQACMRQLQVQ